MKGQQLLIINQLHQVALVIKNPPVNAGDIRDADLIHGLGRSPGKGNGKPLQYCCLETLHGQRNLVGYSLWGRKESDITEQLSTHTNVLHLFALQIPSDNIIIFASIMKLSLEDSREERHIFKDSIFIYTPTIRK